jgi:hypothetical protein
MKIAFVILPLVSAFAPAFTGNRATAICAHSSQKYLVRGKNFQGLVKGGALGLGLTGAALALAQPAWAAPATKAVQVGPRRKLVGFRIIVKLSP